MVTLTSIYGLGLNQITTSYAANDLKTNDYDLHENMRRRGRTEADAKKEGKLVPEYVVLMEDCKKEISSKCKRERNLEEINPEEEFEVILNFFISSSALNFTTVSCPKPNL